ncbi:MULTISPECIES: hypothetical protein [Grimontia]|uniref:DUF1127 domain-containing protein n=1 Tax=Grimontia marina TaxID=646534 RepID=A0A128FK49_9GAMM|nr:MULTISPECIES: hypothetical protein [Grimontia]WRW00987.1 hypothetical protein VP504_21325 [Grimontia sp. NTOU-MAR1]CZF86845.1 hypothetical protein GMA8713_04884 [Grimontia marina]
MRTSEKKNHTLLVASYEQNKEAHLEVSRMMWKLIEKVIANYQTLKLKHQKEKLRDLLSTYPDYLLRDVGLTPEEISLIKARSIQLKLAHIAHSVRRN